MVAIIGPVADNPSDPEGHNAATAPTSGVPSFPAEMSRRLGNGGVLRSKGTGILRAATRKSRRRSPMPSAPIW